MTAWELIARANKQLDRDAELLATLENLHNGQVRTDDWRILSQRRQYLRELQLIIEKEEYYSDTNNETAA